ncbi:type III effector protein [Ralstonia solanacearum]|uniref:type III effector protein n=1 Tax=Ralstonia solanacearum TaxID=305 RepID=UPI001E3897C7|nr:type III effector protein [Ralstonia solanacearum]
MRRFTMSKRSLRFPSILTRHTTQPARDATVAGTDTGTPAPATRRQRQGIFRGLLSVGKRRSADGPPSSGTQTGSPPRITAANPSLSRKASRSSLPETPSATKSGVARQAPKPRASDGPSSSGTASLPKTDSGRVDADVLAASADLSDAGWGIRTLRDLRLNAAQEGGVEAAPVTITPHPGATSEIEEVPVPDTAAHAPTAPGTKPARGTAVMPLNRQTPSPPGTSPIRPTPGINRMPSGLKFDGTHEPSTLMRSLDDKTLSAITEALGLGPLDSATQARDAQIDRAGRRLRNAIIEEAALPPAGTARKLAFYQGLEPGTRGQLGLAAVSADCVISERQKLDKHGEPKHLLRVQFHKSIDRSEYTLASQPGSPNHAAVQNVAQQLAEALGPQYRKDGRQYAIEFVGAMGHKGSSADVFIEHFAKHAKVKPRRIKSTPSTINDAHLRNAEVFRALSPEQMNKLARAADISHLSLREETSTRSDDTVRHDLRLFFGGSENILRDYEQAAVSAVGKVGPVLGAARKAAQIIAQAVEQLQREGHEVRFESIGGVSMGGASAQVFAAALQSRLQFPTPTPLVLLDPQLLNNTQARHATKGGVHDYDFGGSRGVAITLDYPAAPRKSLMGRMKGLGYQSPGLVRIKLALQDGDSVKRLSSGEWVDQPPKPYGPPLTGYHGDLALYTKALLRFTSNLAS